MTNKKVTRRALLMSVTSLLICISMLLGTTFAWFTDEVTSGVNQIVAGNLDVELYHTNPATASNASDEAKKVGSTTKLFQTAIGTDVLWEPEAMTYETFEVRNVGTLALKYQLMLNDVLYNIVTWAADNTAGVEAGEHNLTEVIQIGIIDGVTAPTRADIRAAATQTIKQAMDSSWVAKTSALEPGASQSFTVVLYWPQSTADNNWNLKNTGWTLNDPTTVPANYTWSHANELAVEFGIKLLATQQTSESDSFDNTYDASADGTEAWTGVTEGTANADVTGDSEKTATVTVPVTPAASGYTTVKLENADSDGALDNATSVKLDVETADIEITSSTTAYSIGDDSNSVALIDLDLTVTKTVNNETTTTKATSGFIATVETYIAPGLSTVSLTYPTTDTTKAFSTTQTATIYDTEASMAMPTAVGNAAYAKDTGKLVFVTDHFSQYIASTSDVVYNLTTNTGYTKLKSALSAVNSDVKMILLGDVSLDSNATINGGDVELDLRNHKLTVSRSITANKNLTIKNGTYSYSSAIKGDHNSEITFDHLTVDQKASSSSQMFQIYSKKNQTINFTDCEMTYSGTPGGSVNNGAIVALTGGSDTDNCTINFRNTEINWTDGVPWITFADNTQTCRVTFDLASIDMETEDDRVISSYASNNIRQTEENGMIKFQPVTAQKWVDLVTSQPDTYVVDADGNVEIGSSEAFAWFAKQAATSNFAGKTVKLTADINMSGYDWTPIKCPDGGHFAGTFDGGNHKITKLVSKAPAVTDVTGYGNGIFYSVTGTVKNLYVEKAKIGTDENSIGNIYGIISGYSYGNSVFENIHINNSSVTGYGKVGGILGMGADPNDNTVIKNCSVTNTVIDGVYNCGGLIGLEQGTATLSENVVDVTWKDVYVSGKTYVDKTINGNNGKYWEDNETKYYAAWGTLYTDYQSTVIDDVTYIGLCHNG